MKSKRVPLTCPLKRGWGDYHYYNDAKLSALKRIAKQIKKQTNKNEKEPAAGKKKKQIIR